MHRGSDTHGRKQPADTAFMSCFAGMLKSVNKVIDGEKSNT